MNNRQNKDRQSSRSVKTSLGPSLKRKGSVWIIDLSQMPIFHGLSIISRALGDMIIDQAKSDRIDINVERTVRIRENPELLQGLGVALVKVSAERDAVATLVEDPEAFQDYCRAVFGTLQRDFYRYTVFPQNDKDLSSPLVFRFSHSTQKRRSVKPQQFTFFLERFVSPRRPQKCYLRIIIEDSIQPRLALGAIPHVVVEDLESRTFIAGSTRIAETWAESLRRETERGHRSFIEKRTAQSHLFKQFDQAGLNGYHKICLHWGDDFVDRILVSDIAEIRDELKRVLLAIEDRSVRRLLSDNEVVRIHCKEMIVYVDNSELGRVLNVSLGNPRERLDLDSFLERMPKTKAIAAAGSNALADVHIFLIHHITAEVLGLIAALRRLGCQRMTVLFVAYAGEAPSSYLGPLLELPPDEFRCLALMNVPEGESVEGSYRLSTQYSSLDNAEELTGCLSKKRFRFFEAMQTIAIAEFTRLITDAKQTGARCLILEDGGYLAPVVNQGCLEGRTVEEFLNNLPTNLPKNLLLKDMLDALLIGSVEHTRDGMNRMLAVEEKHGTLAFPAFTIAASRWKISVEAREVAVTVLNAIESILHAAGRVLSHRRCVVLGSRGAIGSQLMQDLGQRLITPDEQLAGVDLKAEDSVSGFSYAEKSSFAELSESVRLRMDLILGVVGRSTLQGADLEDWLLRGESKELVLASGSSKTEEFRGLAIWLDELLKDPMPKICDRSVSISVREIKDPITNRLYSHRFRFEIDIDNDTRQRDVIILANSTPVNFLFYGVPTEIIDGVLAELLASGLGLIRRAVTEELPKTLQIVDRDITPSGDSL